MPYSAGTFIALSTPETPPLPVWHAAPAEAASLSESCERSASKGDEAALLARTIGARAAIPCHYEMFEFNTASPQTFVDECRKIGQGHRVLRCGGRWSSEELG